MTSRTGSRVRCAAGFTLVEVLAAAVILALGTLLLQGGLLRSASLYGRYSNTLKAGLWADAKLWEAREALLYADPPNLRPDQGSFMADGRRYGWSMDVRRMGEDFYSVGLAVRWNEGDFPMELKREMYAARPKTAEEL